MNQPDASALAEPAYALAPALLLTDQGPKPDHVIAVQDGKIVEVGPLQSYLDRHPGRRVTRLAGSVVVPGFVDAHIHLAHVFGKSLIGGEPAQIWRRIWGPIEHGLDVEGCYLSAKWAFLEALRGGYTTLVNYSANSREKNEAVIAAAEETGVRLVNSTGIDNKSGPDAARRVFDTDQAYKEEAIRKLEEHIEHCAAHQRVYPSLICGSFYAVSPKIIGELAQYCASRGVVFQMHSNEHFPEVHECILKFGKRPIELWQEHGALGPKTLLHHAALTTEREIEYLRSSQTAVSYNPVASQWKGNAVAPALAYVERGVRIGLGSNSTRTDAFRALDAAESCQRIAHGMQIIDFSCGAGWTWVDVATRGSADACGLGGITGSLKAGLAADFLVLDMLAPEMMPSWDFEWEMVRYYNRDQIQLVVVDGKPIMQAGRPVGWDDRKFIVDNAPRAAKYVDAAGILRLHGPSGRHRDLRRD